MRILQLVAIIFAISVCSCKTRHARLPSTQDPASLTASAVSAPQLRVNNEKWTLNKGPAQGGALEVNYAHFAELNAQGFTILEYAPDQGFFAVSAEAAGSKIPYPITVALWEASLSAAGTAKLLLVSRLNNRALLNENPRWLGEWTVEGPFAVKGSSRGALALRGYLEQRGFLVPSLALTSIRLEVSAAPTRHLEHTLSPAQLEEIGGVKLGDGVSTREAAAEVDEAAAAAAGKRSTAAVEEARRIEDARRINAAPEVAGDAASRAQPANPWRDLNARPLAAKASAAGNVQDGEFWQELTRTGRIREGQHLGEGSYATVQMVEIDGVPYARRSENLTAQAESATRKQIEKMGRWEDIRQGYVNRGFAAEKAKNFAYQAIRASPDGREIFVHVFDKLRRDKLSERLNFYAQQEFAKAHPAIPFLNTYSSFIDSRGNFITILEPLKTEISTLKATGERVSTEAEVLARATAMKQLQRQFAVYSAGVPFVFEGKPYTMLFHHGDIKPENAMIGSDGIPRFVDFGFSRIVLQSTDAGGAVHYQQFTMEQGTLSTERLFLNNSVYGTPYYLSPEIVNGAQNTRIVGPNVSDQEVWRYLSNNDIHALNVSIYEMMYGSRPFNGKDLPSLIGEITRSQLRINGEVRKAVSWDDLVGQRENDARWIIRNASLLPSGSRNRILASYH